MLVENPSNSLEWMIFLAQKYASMFIKGTWLTLEIAVIGTLVGFVLGYIVGLVNDAKISEGDNVFKKLLMRLLKIIFTVYVEIFRDTPMIVQAMIVYYGIKMLGVEMTPVFAGIVVTVLNTGAYMGETVRAGIGSIDMGQREGAWAMGMSPFKTMLYVVLPQAFSISVPAFMANVIFLLKETSVFIAVSLMDLMFTAKDLIGLYYKTTESLFLLVVFYLLILLPISILGSLLERRLRYAGFGD